MQFNDLLMQIDSLYNREWMDFKMDWSEDEGYTNIIKELEDEERLLAEHRSYEIVEELKKIKKKAFSKPGDAFLF